MSKKERWIEWVEWGSAWFFLLSWVENWFIIIYLFIKSYNLFINWTLTFFSSLGRVQIAIAIVKYYRYKNLLPGYTWVQIICENMYLSSAFRICSTYFAIVARSSNPSLFFFSTVLYFLTIDAPSWAIWTQLIPKVISFSNEINILILDATIDYILSTKRFDKSLFQIKSVVINPFWTNVLLLFPHWKH